MRLAFCKRALLWIAVAAVIFIIAATFFSFSPCLVLRDSANGKIFALWPVDDHSRFSVEFVHSVNQTPVRDVFMIDGGEIVPVETVFYSFGAGMQTELGEGQRLRYNEDGSMSITGFTQRLPQLNYIVGTVSDHILRIEEKNVSLRDLCGENAAVAITIEKRIQFEFGKS